MRVIDVKQLWLSILQDLGEDGQEPDNREQRRKHALALSAAQDFLWAYGVPPHGCLDADFLRSIPPSPAIPRRMSWIHPWTEFDLFGDGGQWCPVCGGRTFTWVRPFGEIFCDGCGARFSCRPTAGDPGLVVDCVPTEFTLSHFLLSQPISFWQVLKECEAGLADRRTWCVQADGGEFAGSLHQKQPVGRRKRDGASPHLAVVRLGQSEIYLEERRNQLGELWEKATSAGERQQIESNMKVFVQAYLYPVDFSREPQPVVHARYISLPDPTAKRPTPVDVVRNATIRPRGHLQVAWVSPVPEAVVEGLFHCPVCGTDDPEWVRPAGALHCTRCNGALRPDGLRGAFNYHPHTNYAGESDGPYCVPPGTVITLSLPASGPEWMVRGPDSTRRLEGGHSIGIAMGVCAVCRKRVPVEALRRYNPRDPYWIHRGLCADCDGRVPTVEMVSRCSGCGETFTADAALSLTADGTGKVYHDAYDRNCRPLDLYPQVRALIRDGRLVFI